jgi:hypothetical protein
MSKFKKKIGWQKYEDYLEKQISSPILTSIIQNVAMQHIEDLQNDSSDEEEHDDEEYEEERKLLKASPMVPLTNQLMDDIAMLSSFDCWIGHTNFDLTHYTKEVLNKVPGVELLKICSRYRFFVGIGRMFDFTQVRNDIEKALIKGE